MELNYKYDGTDDHLDSREIEEDIQAIESEYELDYEEYQGPSDFAAHIRETDPETADIYEAILELRDDIQNVAEEGWDYGVIMVRWEYADGDWAKERAADFGAIPMGGVEGGNYWERIEAATSRWPLSHIDWEEAADELKGESATVEFRGASYFEN